MDPKLLTRIDDFIHTPSDRKKVIIVYGPTASGKTAMSIDIAEYLGTEIISADARQVYRHMDIGTGKATKEEMRSIPHHMLSIIDPDEIFSVVDFRERAEPIIEQLQNEGKIPVICGGTGLYIDALVFERSYPDIEPDWKLRDELEDIRTTHGNEILWKMLHDIDPRYAETLHPNNYRYIMRGIEVFKKSGRSKLDIQDTPTLKYDTLFLTPYDGDRETLYKRIDKRVE